MQASMPGMAGLFLLLALALASPILGGEREELCLGEVEAFNSVNAALFGVKKQR